MCQLRFDKQIHAIYQFYKETWIFDVLKYIIVHGSPRIDEAEQESVFLFQKIYKECQKIGNLFFSIQKYSLAQLFVLANRQSKVTHIWLCIRSHLPD